MILAYCQQVMSETFDDLLSTLKDYYTIIARNQGAEKS